MCKNTLNEKILGIDPGAEHVGWCQRWDGRHMFGEIKLSKDGALVSLEAKIQWADVVICEEYRPREYLQGDGPKTAETIGWIKATCDRLGKPLEMVNHTTWRTRASNAALCAAMGAQDPAGLHLNPDMILTGGHGDDAYWIATCGRKVTP
jgi:hypothetical protein